MKKKTDLIQIEKKALGRIAASRIASGAIVGLGSGSTAEEFIKELGRRVRSGELTGLRTIATSRRSTRLAEEWGIPVFPIETFEAVDVVVDGADEVDPEFNLIKGGGGAHTLEKIVAALARELVIVVDHRKLVERLGTNHPVPIEVILAALPSVLNAVRRLGAIPSLRMDEEKAKPFITDLGNALVDACFEELSSPARLESQLNSIPGVVDNGIFAGLADVVLVSEIIDGQPSVREMSRSGME